MALRWRRRGRPFRPVRFVPVRKGRPGAERPRRKGERIPALFVTVFAGMILAYAAVSVLESRLQPLIAAAAGARVHNMVTAAIEDAVTADLAAQGTDYAALVDVQRDASGAVTALTTDMAALNLLRGRLVGDILPAVEGIDASQIDIPLGVLLDFDLLWGRGPSISARALSVGTVSAEFESRFTSAGVNQTLHRIWLEVSAPVTVLLPGGPVEVPVETSVCVAETVIVGQVPGAFLQAGAAGG